MKYYIYISILACCLSVSSPALAQSTSNCVPPEEGSTQACMFAVGQNSSVIATFDCPSGLTGPNNSCPDAGAHSIKFTVGNVITSFPITITPFKVTGDGRCDSGIPDDADPAYNNNLPPGPPNHPPNIKVPFCYDYALFPPPPAAQQPACVVYRVFGPKPSSGLYSNGVQEQIAWNNVRPTPAGYFHRPRMFDDPDDDHENLADSNCPAINRDRKSTRLN